MHAEAWKPVDAYLSWRETAYSELHHSLFFHTVAYGRTVHERCPRVHTGAYARLSAMATAHTSRTRWVDEGLRALAAAGPDSIRVETIARELGVTKGGFYWHFQDRSELLHEVLDEWERLLLDEVIEQVEAKGGDARAKLRRLFAMASDDAVRVDLAVRDWARHDPDVANRLTPRRQPKNGLHAHALRRVLHRRGRRRGAVCPRLLPLDRQSLHGGRAPGLEAAPTS